MNNFYVVLSREDLFLGFLIIEPGIMDMYSFQSYSCNLQNRSPQEWQTYALQEVKEKFPGYKIIKLKPHVHTEYLIEEFNI